MEAETIKVVLLGDSEADKTGLINNFIYHKYDPDRNASLSAQYVSKTIEFPDSGNSIKFDIWDTPGQEKFRSIPQIFYMDAKAIILVYDITSRNSFESIKNTWYEEVKKNCKQNPILAVVANKAELYESQMVSHDEGAEFAKSIGAIFQTVSKLSDSGVNELFYNIGMTYLTGNRNYYYDSLKKKEEEYRKKRDEEWKKNSEIEMNLGKEKEKDQEKEKEKEKKDKKCLCY